MKKVKVKVKCFVCNNYFYKKLEKYTAEFCMCNFDFVFFKCKTCGTKEKIEELKKEIATHNRVTDIIIEPLLIFLSLFFVFGTCLSILKFGAWTVPIIFIIASVPAYIAFKNYHE